MPFKVLTQCLIMGAILGFRLGCLGFFIPLSSRAFQTQKPAAITPATIATENPRRYGTAIVSYGAFHVSYLLTLTTP